MVKDKIIHTQFNVIDDDIIEPKELIALKEYEKNIPFTQSKQIGLMQHISILETRLEERKQAIINFKEVLLKKVNKKKLSEKDVKLLINVKDVKCPDEWITIRELKQMLVEK